MKLGDYLNSKNLSDNEFARQLGVEQSTVTRLVARDGRQAERKPSFKLMARIAAATGGQVMPNDFMSDLPELIEGFDLPSGENEPPTSALTVPACIRRAS